jgi:hypothetical protein
MAPLDQDDIITSVGGADVEVRQDEKLSMSALVKPPCPTCNHGATRVTVALPFEYDALKPERIVIKDGSADWIVNDILIGSRSQLSQQGDIQGDVFAEDQLDSFASFDTIQRRMEFTIVVTYVGLNPVGGMFSADVIGMAVMHREAT